MVRMVMILAVILLAASAARADVQESPAAAEQHRPALVICDLCPFWIKFGGARIGSVGLVPAALAIGRGASGIPRPPARAGTPRCAIQIRRRLRRPSEAKSRNAGPL